MPNNANKKQRQIGGKDFVAYVRMDQETAKSLRRIAKRDERSLSFVIREAVRDYLTRSCA